MIHLTDVCKEYPTRSGPVQVLRHINLEVRPGERIGILGRNGAGKSTLVRLIAGAERPTSGRVVREMSVSWPLAFGGAFQGGLTGADNLRFICRIYGVDFRDRIGFVQEFSELGRYFREPVRTYSSGMRARLSFAISLVVEFDCYLIDEIVTVGDARFTQKCHDELFVKRRDRAKIIVSHHADYLEEHCDHAAILDGGILTPYDTIAAAQQQYMSLCS